MDDLILRIATNAGPLVLLAGLFLYFDWRNKTRAAEALDRLADSFRSLADSLATRPCLWVESQQRLLKSLERLVDRMAQTGLDETGQRTGARS